MTGISVSSVSATSMTLSELFETYIACSRCCVPFRRIEALGSTTMGGSCGADQSVVQGAVETSENPSRSWSFVSVGSLGRWRPMVVVLCVLRGRRAVRRSFKGSYRASESRGTVSLALLVLTRRRRPWAAALRVRCALQPQSCVSLTCPLRVVFSHAAGRRRRRKCSVTSLGAAGASCAPYARPAHKTSRR